MPIINNTEKHSSPARTLVVGFLLIIVAGTLLYAFRYLPLKARPLPCSTACIPPLPPRA